MHQREKLLVRFIARKTRSRQTMKGNDARVRYPFLHALWIFVKIFVIINSLFWTSMMDKSHPWPQSAVPSGHIIMEVEDSHWHLVKMTPWVKVHLLLRNNGRGNMTKLFLVKLNTSSEFLLLFVSAQPSNTRGFFLQLKKKKKKKNHLKNQNKATTNWEGRTKDCQCPKPRFDFFGLYFVNGSTCKSTNIAIQPNYQVNRDNSLNIALARLMQTTDKQTYERTNNWVRTYAHRILHRLVLRLRKVGCKIVIDIAVKI